MDEVDELTTAQTGAASSRKPPWLSLLILGLVIAGLLVAFRLLPVDQWVEELKRWIATTGVRGPVIFAGIYVLATLAMVPGLILTLAAGALFGLVPGFVVVSLASTSGAALAFLTGRYLARARIARLANRYPGFSAVDRAIAEGGWRVVVLLRLSPAVPFNLQNWFYGMTSVAFWPCMLASWIAMMPGTFLYVYLGHVAGLATTGEEEGSTAQAVLWAVGLLATLVVTIYITRLARRQLNEQLDQDS